LPVGTQAVFFLPQPVSLGGSESTCSVQDGEEPPHIIEPHQFFHERAGRD
jgi:hypothetical protein